MKFTLTFKMPDVLNQLTHDFETEKQDEAKAFAEKYVKYGEYISVEFDTENKTAVAKELHK